MKAKRHGFILVEIIVGAIIILETIFLFFSTQRSAAETISCVKAKYIQEQVSDEAFVTLLEQFHQEEISIDQFKKNETGTLAFQMPKDWKEKGWDVVATYEIKDTDPNDPPTIFLISVTITVSNPKLDEKSETYTLCLFPK